MFLRVEFLYSLWEKHIFLHLFNFLKFVIASPLPFEFLIQLRHLFSNHFPFIRLFHLATWLRIRTTCSCKPTIFDDTWSLCLLLQECSSLLSGLCVSIGSVASLWRFNLTSLNFLIRQQILRVLSKTVSQHCVLLSRVSLRPIWLNLIDHRFHEALEGVLHHLC